MTQHAASARSPAPLRQGGKSAPASAAGENAAMAVLRPALFLISFFITLVSLTPFKDRSGAEMLQAFEGGSLANRVVFPLLLLLVGVTVWRYQRNFFRLLLTSAAIPFVLWLLLTSLTSADPLLSLRRSMLFIVHMLLTCLALALPRSERQLQWLYAVCCLVVLGLSYIGVALLPNLSIHQAYDAVEADLAGNWRGVFEHKNAAGCVMVVFVFMGLYIARSYNAAIGWLIAAASVVFLIFSHSKTSIALLPVVLVVAYFFERCRSTSARALTGLSLLVAINFAAIGASFPGPVRQALQYAMPDVSFTGRTHLWAFAITNIAEHPILGHGSGAFWRTGSTMYKDREAAEPEDISGWAAELGTDSHNGYIETALSTGIPGLLLILFWLVLTPLLDYPRAVGSPSNRPLATLYVRIWLYSLYLGSLETIPSVQNPAWFLMLQAMFGLALLARMRVR